MLAPPNGFRRCAAGTIADQSRRFIAHSGRYALADVVGPCVLEARWRLERAEKRGDALVPMAHSVGGGEIPLFSWKREFR